MRSSISKKRMVADWVLVSLGGRVPTLEVLPPSDALSRVRAFAQTRSDE